MVTESRHPKGVEGRGCQTLFDHPTSSLVGLHMWPTTAFSFFTTSNPVGSSRPSLAADSAC